MAPKQLGSKQHSAVEKTLAGINGNNRVSHTPTISPANLSGHVSAQLAAAEISCGAVSVDALEVRFKAAAAATILMRGLAILTYAVTA